MAVERAAGGTSLIDVLDRVLDKGIVIDAWVRVSLVGIDLITVEARVVVASIDTYLKYSEAVGQVAPVSRPAAELPSHQDVVAENAAAARRARRPSKSSRPRRSAPRRREEPAPPRRRADASRDSPRVTRRRAGGAGSGSRCRTRSSRFVEFLLTSIDVQESARRAVDWLVAHAPVTEAAVLVAEPLSNEMLLVAEHGVSSGAIMDFALSRDDGSHPLIQALHSAGADLRRRAAGPSPRRRSRRAPFHAIPLRADASEAGARPAARRAALGARARCRDALARRARSASRCRGCSAASCWPRRRFGQERMLLYSIINAVTDPILLTDTEGKLLIANSARARSCSPRRRKRAKAGAAPSR